MLERKTLNFLICLLDVLKERFTAEDFEYKGEENTRRCPAGKEFFDKGM
jgi:hypothetical protein